MHVSTREANRASMKRALPLALALVFALSACGTGGKVDLSTVSTTALEKSDLMASVNASGTVESANSQKVIPDTKLNGYMIQSVSVEVGDVVKKGDILATLDTSELERQVEQQEAALAAQKKQAGTGYDSASRNYDTARKQYSEGRGAGVTSAQASVNNAQAGVDSAISGVDNAQAGVDKALSNVDSAIANVDKAISNVEQAKSGVTKAQSAVGTAEQALKEAQDAYNNAMVLYELGEYSDSEIQRYREDVERAQRNVNDARLGVDDAKRAVTDAEANVEDAKRAVTDAERAVGDAERAVSDAERVVSDAEQSLRDAERALSDTRKNAADSVESAYDSVASASASMDFESSEIAIQAIRDQIADGVIKAPMDGTITLSNATVGSAASGVLFMIEDIDNLIIKTTVQQFDAPSVSIGQEVIIKSDGTGDKEFGGTVQRIAPTAVKSTTGDLAAGSGIEFETEIVVDDSQSGLLIGMSTQLYIVTDRRTDVFAVPFNAIAQDKSGKDLIYIVEGEGKEMTTRAIEVTIGLETDFYVEITGTGLQEGLQVVNNPDDLFPEGNETDAEPQEDSSAETQQEPDVAPQAESDAVTEDESDAEPEDRLDAEPQDELDAEPQIESHADTKRMRV